MSSQESKSTTVVVDTVKDPVAGFSLPTLDQFMKLISNEDQAMMATTSGYNVYNKYNKTS